ncbi:MAG: hypothetical protein A2114_02840 [Candidatus Vogelbacteria bacterium GWA1_51_14]|uniref:Uncharacterized protein n=1 Tax=Candidatus Vogelbacteria bacterium GWA1_51_14 TaxID=1802435 RepID=A0A1G2Q9D6_9BACT|nr:MAG: hypothetical protein A2114_02840 [Candidatus Vogelbacteria bacterium GWA1_51_14]
MIRLIWIFVIAFGLNALWENFHSGLYVHYRGGEITEFILLRAAVVDAVMIALIAAPFIFWPALNRRSWLIIIAGLIVAVALERFALATGRWAYNDLMPIIPLLATGLTPTIQLGLLGFLSFKLANKLSGYQKAGITS